MRIGSILPRSSQLQLLRFAAECQDAKLRRIREERVPHKSIRVNNRVVRVIKKTTAATIIATTFWMVSPSITTAQETKTADVKISITLPALTNSKFYNLLLSYGLPLVLSTPIKDLVVYVKGSDQDDTEWRCLIDTTKKAE